MKIYAALDTNVIVSALIKKESNPGKVVKMALSGKIIPVMHEKIRTEYLEVLQRKKFNFPQDVVARLMARLVRRAVFLDRTESEENVPDPKDKVFYEVTLTARKKFRAGNLVTGNLRHFPTKPFVVSPAEFVAIVENAERENGGL